MINLISITSIGVLLCTQVGPCDCDMSDLNQAQVINKLNHVVSCVFMGSGSPVWSKQGKPVWTNGGVPHGGEKKNLFNGGDGM